MTLTKEEKRKWNKLVNITIPWLVVLTFFVFVLVAALWGIEDRFEALESQPQIEDFLEWECISWRHTEGCIKLKGTNKEIWFCNLPDTSTITIEVPENKTFGDALMELPKYCSNEKLKLKEIYGETK